MNVDSGVWPLLLLAPLVDLDWDAPSDCPSEDAFVAMVDAEARVQLESNDPPVLDASVAVEQLADERWRLVLRMRRGAGAFDVRTMHGESCEAVVDDAALDCTALNSSCHVDECSVVAVNVDTDPEDWATLDGLLGECEAENPDAYCNFVGECGPEIRCGDTGRCEAVF
jgi:hypothetical protein